MIWHQTCSLGWSFIKLCVCFLMPQKIKDSHYFVVLTYNMRKWNIKSFTSNLIESKRYMNIYYNMVPYKVFMFLWMEIQTVIQYRTLFNYENRNKKLFFLSETKTYQNPTREILYIKINVRMKLQGVYNVLCDQMTFWPPSPKVHVYCSETMSQLPNFVNV